MPGNLHLLCCTVYVDEEECTAVPGTDIPTPLHDHRVRVEPES